MAKNSKCLGGSTYWRVTVEEVTAYNETRHDYKFTFRGKKRSIAYYGGQGKQYPHAEVGQEIWITVSKDRWGFWQGSYYGIAN